MEKSVTRKNDKSQKEPRPDLKTSTINLLLNIAIFVLGAVIIFMIYSLYVKLGNKNDPTNLDLYSQSAADIIQVEVLNGCGVGGVADRFTEYLRNNNIDVVSSGNYSRFDMDESIVIDRIGNMANAYKVAQTLGIQNSNVIQQLNKDYFLDVSIVVGRDYFKMKPFK